MGELFDINEAHDKRNEVYDRQKILKLPAELIDLLDTIEDLGGPGYEIVVDYQTMIMNGFSTELAVEHIVPRAEAAMRELGVA